MFSDYFNDLIDNLSGNTNQVALVHGDISLSFHELGLRVGAILKALPASDPAGPVLVRGHKEPDVVAAMIAAVLAGRSFVFVERDYPSARVQQVVDTCSCTVLVDVTTSNADGFGIPKITASQLVDQPLECQQLRPQDEDKPFYITFTSGSTGQPKGIQIRRRNFASLTQWLDPLITDVDCGDVACVNHASMAFDMSMSDIWNALFMGNATYLLDHKHNANPYKNISILTKDANVPAGTLCSTPAFLEIMLETQRFNTTLFPRLKAFWVGGEEVPKPLLKRLLAAFPDSTIFHSYGPSEATCVTHCTPISMADLEGEGTLSLGHPQGLTQVRVDQGDGVLHKSGRGEIVLLGPQVAEGYLPASHPNNAKFGAEEGTNSYHTGDLGILDETGAMTVVGRIDRQIKLNGLRIELGAIEQCAMQVKGVNTAVVLPPIGPTNMMTLVMAGVNLDEASKAEVRARILSELPVYMLPGSIEIETQLPRNLSGKIDVKELSARRERQMNLA